MSNTITAFFKGRVGVAEAVYQNDYGIVMNFDSIELPAHFDCYFSITGEDEAIPGIGADRQVVIPNSCLSKSGTVTLHIPIHTGSNDSEVEYVVYFKVIGRARPIDDGTPEQMTAIEQALALLQNPIENIEQIVNEALDFTGDTFAEMQEQLDADQAAFKEEVRSDISEVESDFDNLNAQFQTAIGAVTVDDELLNVRVGDDNVTYATAGEAVRKQFSQVKSNINKLICPNLMGNKAGVFYPVYIKAGEKITVSTSDGSVFSTSNTLQIQLRRADGSQSDYFSLKNNLTYRTITAGATKGDVYYLSWNETPSVPLMVNHGSSALPYTEYFESVPTEIDNLFIDGKNKTPKKTITLPLISGSYYSTVNGTTQVASGWSRTNLYDLDCEGAFFRTSASGRCMAVFYDENRNFLYASGVRSTDDASMVVLFRHPNSNVKYYAFCINSIAISELVLDVITADGLISIEQPYDGFEYLFRENYWMNGSGVMQATENFNMFVIPNIDKYTHIFSNEDATYNALFYDDNNHLISNGSEFERISPVGKLFTVPSNAKHVVMNMHKSYIDQTNGNYSVYISLVKDGDGLQGKKVACIGDSITWLDGRSGYDGATNFVGYEAELRKRGASVFNLGWSGYPYADLTERYADYGIHKQIVTNAVDVSSYDIAVLFGGANDLLYSSPLGDASDDYNNPNIDGSTFNGAIGGIINYIRQNNPACKIYLCTMLPSEAATRSYATNKAYRDAVIQNGEFWQVPVIDLYSLINVHPGIHFSDYFYDVTHPNVHGMKRIGEAIASFIEHYL